MNSVFSYIVIAGLFLKYFGIALAADSPDEFVNMPWLMVTSDFVFKGIVVDVQYRNSESVPFFDPDGNPILDEEGNTAYADGSDIPHTFVTYQIEQIYKGPRMPPTEITLRIAGGESDNDDLLQKRWLFIEPYPIFNVGDRDVLFLEGNTRDACPLAGGQSGRFRLFTDLNFPDQNNVFSDLGMEIRVIATRGEPVRGWPVLYGPQHIRPEVTTRRIGQEVIEFARVNPTEGILPVSEDQPAGEPFSESFFDTYLTVLVGELFTPEELMLLPPVETADISRPFQGSVLEEIADPISFPPNPCFPADSCEQPRPWLDELLTPEQHDELLENERLEMEWLTRSGGNPVLPQTSCEESILLHGAMPGDISGPEGKVDCRVNLFDLAIIASNWLQCDGSTTECL